MRVSSKPHDTAQATDSVRCLAIPLLDSSLLLPYTTVAEVTDFEAPVPVPNAPRWLWGLMRWRGLNVPLIMFDRLLGDEASFVGGRPQRVVVLNTLNGDPRLPFLAVAVAGIPRLSQVTARNVEPIQKRDDDGASVLERVKMEGAEFIIPDFDALEQMLLRLGL